jgi:AcrR family transcriptional regulator
MSETVLTREQILAAAEEVLRRYGPAKATVVDVARALGVSHGSVYRHFESKKVLRDAVTEHWLARIAAPLAAAAAEPGPAPLRLRRWLALLAASKRERAGNDPELFATYITLVTEARATAGAHVAALVAQIAGIIADGVASGEFAPVAPQAAAQAIFDATVRFHNPIHAAEWAQPGMAERFAALCDLLLRGLGCADAPDHR